MPAVEGDGLVVGMLNLPTQVDRGIALHFHSSLHSTRAGSLPAPARTADWSAIRAGQHLTGRKIEAELQGVSPTSFCRRSNSSLRHPGFRCWEQAAGGFQCAAQIRPLPVSEGTPAFTTAQSL